MPTIGLADFQRMWATHRQGFLDAMERVGQSGWLVLGREVESFEQSLAAFWGLPHAVGVASGLDALEIAFRCAGMQSGDRVLTTPMTAFATTLAIVRVGAIPVFVDTDASGQLDLDQAEAVLRQRSWPIRFIVPVHLFGHALDMGRLESLASKHNVTVIEDCAQAIGAKSHGRKVGTLGRVCATSFYPTKNLGALGDAGALLTSDADIAARARTLRDYGQSAKYQHSEIGMNSRLDELQAALLRSVQLPALSAQTERRKVIAGRYLRELVNPAATPLPIPEGSDSVWHLFPLQCRRRDELKAHLAAAGIASGVHYPALVPDQPAMKSVPHFVATPLDRARRLASEELSIPMHSWLNDQDVGTVIAAVNAFKATP